MAWEIYPLHFIVVSKNEVTKELVPRIIFGKQSGHKGLAAFDDMFAAAQFCASENDDVEISSHEKEQFGMIVRFFKKTLGITHVAIFHGHELPDKAIWIQCDEWE